MYRDVVLVIVSKWDAMSFITFLLLTVQKKVIVLWKKMIGSSQGEALEVVLLQ
jgi:hypothetical protein